MRSLSYIVGLSAIALSFSPLQPEFKIITSLTGAGVMLNVAIEDGKKKRLADQAMSKTKTDLDLALLDLELKQNELERDWFAIAQLREEVTLEKSQLENLLKNTENLTIQELATREKVANDRIAENVQSLDKEIKLVRSKAAAAIRRARARQRSQVRQSEIEIGLAMMALDQKIKEARSKAAAAIRRAKSKNWQNFDKFNADIENRFNAEMTQLWAIAMSAKENADEKLRSQAGQIATEETAAAKAASEALESMVVQGQEAIAKFRATADDELAGDIEDGQDFLAKLADQIRKEVETTSKDILNLALATMSVEVSEAQIRLEEALENIERLQGELAAIAKPVFCPYENWHGEKSNRFIRFIHESMGVKLVWESSIRLNGDVLQLDFTFHESEKVDKAIAKLNKPQNLEAIGVKFGNAGVIIAANPIDHCWRVTIPPNEGYRGSDNTYQIPVSEVANGLEASLRKQMDYEATRGYMMDFTPVTPIDLPRSYEATSQELTTLQWYFFWRSEATGQANIKSVKGLLKEVYGATEEAGRAIDPVTRESLCDRIDRLLTEVSNEYVSLSLGESNE